MQKHQPISLEDFLVEHAFAAVYAYKSPQLRHLLQGEEELMPAVVVLLKEQLKRAPEYRDQQQATTEAKYKRAKREGTYVKRATVSGLIGVAFFRGKWQVRCKHQKQDHFIGTFTDKYEAARAYDRYIIENGLPKKTNAGEGLLP